MLASWPLVLLVYTVRILQVTCCRSIDVLTCTQGVQLCHEGYEFIHKTSQHAGMQDRVFSSGAVETHLYHSRMVYWSTGLGVVHW